MKLSSLVFCTRDIYSEVWIVFFGVVKVDLVVRLIAFLSNIYSQLAALAVFSYPSREYVVCDTQWDDFERQ